MSAQGRDAPAFQEYAASMLSALPFRRAKLSERGLLFTLRRSGTSEFSGYRKYSVETSEGFSKPK